MKMETDFETVLDIALGGPEFGPLNLSILHGLFREVFHTFNLSSKSLLIEDDNPDFSNSFNFLKSKIDEKISHPKSSGGGYQRLRSKVSVIVGDYARTPVGQSTESKPSILPADAEDRLRYLESQIKIVKNFPNVDELRNWAKEKTSPDTVVTDLWHFVSLNHRMDGAEEGIQKLTELVDKLIAELKGVTDSQGHLQGQIDDLYSQLKGLSERTSNLDNRIDSAGEKAIDKVCQIEDKIDELKDTVGGYAKLTDLEDFVLKDTFIDAQDKANTMAEQFNEELATKAPISMLDDFVDQGELQRLKEWVNTLRSQMETVPTKDDLAHLDLYVKWPQLEDALMNYPKRPCSRSSSVGHDYMNRSSVTISRNSSRPSSTKKSRNGSASARKIFPSENCWQKLNELGGLLDRQNDLMDALERTREQLADKANKSDLEDFVTQEDLNKILHLLKDMKEELNGLQTWRNIVDDEKVPALRELLSDLEQQVASLLENISELKDEDKRKARALENLFTYVDRLEENKLDKDDVMLQELKKDIHDQRNRLPSLSSPPPSKTSVTSPPPLNTNDERKKSISKDDLENLNNLINKIKDKIADMEVSYDKSINDILHELDEKLDRAELQPLREYLESRYNTLVKQADEKPADSTDFSNQHTCTGKKIKPTKAEKEYEPNFTHTIVSDDSTSPSRRSTPKKTTPKSAPVSKSTRIPGVVYDPNETLGCSHPHYGDGGFFPSQSLSALMRSPMRFNCLACDRPLVMKQDRYFQTVRGKDRPLTGYELDQLKILQKILKGNKQPRACGGRHTSSIPPSYGKKMQNKMNSTFPSVNNDYIISNDVIDAEIDIEGIDGRFYKGLLSRKDLPYHDRDRTRSANSNLRTVSPTPKGGFDRPISSKSLDFDSSYTSGLGASTHSVEIPTAR